MTNSLDKVGECSLTFARIQPEQKYTTLEATRILKYLGGVDSL
jgi:hypothetical protein